jgi:GTP1/Obg family GTP-binding protein
LCLGENDFLPKYQGISHEKWISTVIDTPGTLTNLIKFKNEIEKRCIAILSISADVLAVP